MVEDPDSLQQLLTLFSAIEGAKILVHGGGRSATRLSERLGMQAQMHQGRRITDADTLEVVTMVYAGWVNKNIVARLQALHLNALGLTGADLNLIVAQKRAATPIDYGFVGDVQSVQTNVVAGLLQMGVVPVVTPITHDGHGQLLNTNADTIASELAVALASHFEVSLMFCFEKPGVLLRAHDDASAIASMDEAYFQKLQAEGVVSEGMIPKLQNGFAALHKGVHSVIIGRVEGVAESFGTKLIV